MELTETQKNLLTTIAENQPKVKQQGYDEGYDAGKQAEYDAFWDNIQHNGNRDFYEYGFHYWGSEYIRPKYKVVTSSNSRNISIFSVNRTLKKIEKEYFDLSNYIPSSTIGTRCNYSTFYNCNALEEIEDIGLQAGGYYYTYNNCQKLKRIELMRCCEEGMYQAPFTSCNSLTDLTIEGVIGTSFPISYSPLSIASLKSIIKHLKPYYGTDKEFTYTLTVKTSAWEALEEAGFTDEDYQWVFDNWGTPPSAYDSWETLMGGWLGWNLVLA